MSKVRGRSSNLRGCVIPVLVLRNCVILILKLSLGFLYVQTGLVPRISSISPLYDDDRPCCCAYAHTPSLSQVRHHHLATLTAREPHALRPLFVRPFRPPSAHRAVPPSDPLSATGSGHHLYC